MAFPINFPYQCMLKKFYIKKEFFVQHNKKQAKLDIQDYYQFQTTIGRGSFGVVYKAQMKYYPYSVRAIKRIKTKYIKNPEATMREYAVLKSLDHPNIVKIYETYEDEDNLFLVTDYCQGGELFAQLSKTGNLTENEARALFIQMVNIIKYCHANKVVHRDLKPQNFLFTSNKHTELMLIDFGLSFRWKKNLRQQIAKTQGNKIVGTAYYMAPEIFTSTYDERCDIWSLGIILFMLITGQPPVDGTTVDQIIQNIRGGRLNLAVLAKRDISPEVSNLILKILVRQEKRISIAEIMQHPWMTLHMEERKLNINFEKIRSYSKFSKVVLCSRSSKFWPSTTSPLNSPKKKSHSWARSSSKLTKTKTATQQSKSSATTSSSTRSGRSTPRSKTQSNRWTQTTTAGSTTTSSSRPASPNPQPTAETTSSLPSTTSTSTTTAGSTLKNLKLYSMPTRRSIRRTRSWSARCCRSAMSTKTTKSTFRSFIGILLASRSDVIGYQGSFLSAFAVHLELQQPDLFGLISKFTLTEFDLLLEVPHAGGHRMRSASLLLELKCQLLDQHLSFVIYGTICKLSPQLVALLLQVGYLCQQFQIFLLQIADDPLGALQLLLKMQVLVPKGQICVLGCLFTHCGKLVLHFDDDLAHLQIGPFPVLRVHADLAYQTHQLISELDV